MITVANEAQPENSVSTDEHIRADLARLLQARLVHESGLGVFAHPILIGVIAALAWPDAPHDLLRGWVAAVTVGALLRGGWLFIGTRRKLSDRAVRNGVRSTVVLLAITWGVGGAIVLPIVPFETAALILVGLARLLASALTTPAARPMSISGLLPGVTPSRVVSLATREQRPPHAPAVHGRSV